MSQNLKMYDIVFKNEEGRIGKWQRFHQSLAAATKSAREIVEYEFMGRGKLISVRQAGATHPTRVDANRAKKSTKNRLESIAIQIIPDDDPDPSFLEQEGWEKRLREYQRGDFHFVGVRAVAEILIPQPGGGGITQHIESPGLWGTESDSDAAHFKQIGAEEIDQLRDMLAAMNVDLKPFAAMKKRALHRN